MDRAPVVDALRRYFAGNSEIVAAYLFGSVARGEGRASSDVDVGVVLARGAPRALADYDPVLAIQTAVQAAIDVAAVIVAERGLGEPANNREMFAKLAADGWLPAAEIDVWKRIVSFRNIVVHRYLELDPSIVKAIVGSHLDD